MVAIRIGAMLLVATSSLAAEPSLPERQQIVDLALKVNAYQAAHPVVKGNNRRWERGTWYTGVMALYNATSAPGLLEQALQYGAANAYQPGTEKSGGNILTC